MRSSDWFTIQAPDQYLSWWTCICLAAFGSS